MRSITRTAAFCWLVWALFAGGFPPAEARAGTPGESASPPRASAGLPAFEIPVPALDADRSYLGLTGSGAFKIDQVKAQVVIIEVFNFYCPHCQRAAPIVNQVYRDARNNGRFGEKIRMIGIGAGNSPYEVEAFKEKYAIPFPLFPDQDFAITRLLGIEFTPTFIGVKLGGERGPEQFYFKHGEFQDPQQFLAEMVRLSGLE